jgi:hypothetical protein
MLALLKHRVPASRQAVNFAQHLIVASRAQRQNHNSEEKQCLSSSCSPSIILTKRILF